MTLRPPGEGRPVVATEALPPDGDSDAGDDAEFTDLVPMLRRVVAARVKDPHVVDDLVQETLVRVMAARSRVEPDKLPQYAAVTARNLVASMAEKNDRARSRSHLLVEAIDGESPVTDILRQEQRSIVKAALAQLPAGDRDMLVAHEVDGRTPSRWRPGVDRPPERSRLDSVAPARACGSNTCWWLKASSRPPTVAGRCSVRCPAVTGGGSGAGRQRSYPGLRAPVPGSRR